MTVPVAEDRSLVRQPALVGRLRPPGTGGGWEPAVDGLRGVAVVTVLLYHAEPTVVPGGYLGVSLFFTLSGYLITSMLVREHETTGQIGIARFWGRRARRLVPVAVAGLGLATVVAWATMPSDRVAAIAADVRWAAANLGNWHQLGAGTEYGDVLSAPSPVTHYWSLAIEEQFYVVFPLVAALALRVGRRWLGAVLVVATVGSLASQLAAESANRAYLGTDARLSEITIGALLALLLAARPVHRPRTALWDIAGLVSFVVLAVGWLLVPLGEFPLRQGGLLAHALVASCLVASVLRGHRVRQLLSTGPLVAVGLLSYGVYVVHFPLFLWLSPERTHLDGPALVGVRIGLSIALAAMLHLLIERPVRWRGSLPGWQAGLGWITATACVVLIGLALPQVSRQVRPGEEVALNGSEATVVLMPEGPMAIPRPAPVGSTTSTTLAAPDTTVPDSGPSGAPAVEAGPGAPTPAAGPDRAMRLLVIGDSTAGMTGAGMQQWAAESGLAAVDVVSGPGCAFEQTGVPILREGWELPPPAACFELLDSARDAARQHPPDAVVVFIGNMQLAEWRLGDAPATLAIGDPAFDGRYVESANASLAAIEALGAPVLWATVPVPAWDPSVMFGGHEPPGTGPLTINDSGRTARLNQLNSTIVQAHPLVRLVPYAQLISNPDGSIDRRLRPDGLHLDPDEVPGVMERGFEAALRDAYRSALVARPDVARPGSVLWSS